MSRHTTGQPMDRDMKKSLHEPGWVYNLERTDRMYVMTESDSLFRV